MPGIPVRHGSAIAHVPDLDAAAQLMLAFSKASARPRADKFGRSGMAGEEPQADLRGAVDRAASTALGLLVAKFSIRGRAQTSLSTALRIKQIRHHIGPTSDLEEHLRYIASAADAFRHLTPSLVEKKVRALADLCDSIGAEQVAQQGTCERQQTQP